MPDFVERLKQEDPKAQDELIRVYRPVIDQFVRRHIWHLKPRIPSLDDVIEDVIQEASLRLLSAIKNYKDDGKLAAFIIGVTKNVLNDHIRIACRYENRLYRGDITNPKVVSAIKTNDPCLLIVNQGYMDSWIDILSKHLDPKAFQAFYLLEFDNMTYIGISKIQNVPIGTVRSRINRARKTLSRTLHHIDQDVWREYRLKQVNRVLDEVALQISHLAQQMLMNIFIDGNDFIDVVNDLMIAEISEATKQYNRAVKYFTNELKKNHLAITEPGYKPRGTVIIKYSSGRTLYELPLPKENRNNS